MERDFLKAKKRHLCQLGYEICQLFSTAAVLPPISSIRDLHPKLHEFVMLGVQLVEFSLDPIFRKNLRVLMMDLNDSFVQTQMTEVQPLESSLVSRSNFVKKLFDICTFVKRYKKEKSSKATAEKIYQINNGVSKLIDFGYLKRPHLENYNNEATEKLLAEISSYQINKLTIKDLERSSYRKIEKQISYIKTQAYGGGKEVMVWSCFLAEVHELFGVATQLLKDVSLSLTLSPSEEMKLKENLKNMSELLAVFHSSVHDTIRLNVDSSDFMERSAVLLTNTIYLLRNVINTELNVWNPRVQDLSFNKVFRNSGNFDISANILRLQLEKLFNIFTLSSPSTEEWMRPIQEIRELYNRLTSGANIRIKKNKNVSTMESYKKEMSLSMVESNENDRESIQRCLLYKIYQLMYNTFNSLALFLSTTSVKEAISTFDWSNMDSLIDSLVREVGEMITSLESKKCKESLLQGGSKSFKTKDNIIVVSSHVDERIHRLKLMKEFLSNLLKPQHQPILNEGSLTLLPLPLKPLQALPPFTSSSDFKDYKMPTLAKAPCPFDVDCLKLFVLFCKVQMKKTKVFLEKSSEELLTDEFKFIPLQVSDQPSIFNSSRNLRSDGRALESNIDASSATKRPTKPPTSSYSPNLAAASNAHHGEEVDEALLDSIDGLLKQSRDFYNKFNASK